MTNVYGFKIPKRKGGELDLSTLKGKVLVIVNTATGCGFTPQYEGLQKLYENYHSKGLEIIDVPCNQFGNQTPGTDDEIHEFCTAKYKTKYEQMKKSDVNGDKRLPVFGYLTSKCAFKGFTGEKAKFMDEYLRKANPDYDKNNDIKWNFTKFVVNKNGEAVARFEPTQEINEVEECVKKLL